MVRLKEGDRVLILDDQGNPTGERGTIRAWTMPGEQKDDVWHVQIDGTNNYEGKPDGCLKKIQDTA